MKNNEALTAMFEGLEVKHPDLSEGIFWSYEDHVFCSALTRKKIDGAFLLNKFPTGWELVEEEPKVVLCPADVGRRVRLENGDIVLVTWCAKDGSAFGSNLCNWDKFGKDDGDSDYNIKELLK